MITENAELMQMAKESLKGKWPVAVGTFFVWMLVANLIQLIPYAGSVLSILISGPLTLGISYFSLSISRDENTEFDLLFMGFKDKFGVAIGAYLLTLIFSVLWTLLLIIPGIIAALSY